MVRDRDKMGDGLEKKTKNLKNGNSKNWGPEKFLKLLN
jgi:hypothetical protein